MAQVSVYGECPICLEQVNSVKVLPCKHKFCIECVKSTSKGSATTIQCPFCREFHEVESLYKLPTLHNGDMNGNLCKEDSPTSSIYWCSSCVQIMCSTCVIDVHMSKGHQVVKWETLQEINDCILYSERVAVAQENILNSTEVDAEALGNITDFCQALEKELVKRLEKSAAEFTDGLQKPSFHQEIKEFVGQMNTSDAHELHQNEHTEKVESIAGQIMDLVTGVSGNDFSGHFRLFTTRSSVENIGKTVEEWAEEVWTSLQIKHEKVSDSATAAQFFKTFDLRKCLTQDQTRSENSRSILLTTENLTTAEGTEVYRGAEINLITSWSYEGDGTHLWKVFSLICNNTKIHATALHIHLKGPAIEDLYPNMNTMWQFNDKIRALSLYPSVSWNNNHSVSLLSQIFRCLRSLSEFRLLCQDSSIGVGIGSMQLAPFPKRIETVGLYGKIPRICFFPSFGTPSNNRWNSGTKQHIPKICLSPYDDAIDSVVWSLPYMANRPLISEIFVESSKLNLVNQAKLRDATNKLKLVKIVHF